MKKIAIYIGILILIVFLIPIIFTKQLPKVIANPENKIEEDKTNNKIEQNKEQDNNIMLFQQKCQQILVMKH